MIDEWVCVECQPHEYARDCPDACILHACAKHGIVVHYPKLATLVNLDGTETYFIPEAALREMEEAERRQEEREAAAYDEEREAYRYIRDD